MTTTTFYIIFVPILAIILLAVNLVLAPHNPYQEKDSVFECGFHSFLGQNRTQFSVSFFIFGLLFLLFDLEILLVFPYSVSSYNNDYYGLSVMMLFFVLLTLGFVFELGKNALTIESKQTFTQKVKSLPTLTGYIIYLDNYIMNRIQPNLSPLNKGIDGVVKSGLFGSLFSVLWSKVTYIYNSVTVRKVIAIFLVGLISRPGVGHTFEIVSINDPLRIGANGYRGPGRGANLGSYQPYASNLAEGMKKALGIYSSLPLHGEQLDPVSDAFIAQYLITSYPNMDPSEYKNNAWLRRQIKNLP